MPNPLFASFAPFERLLVALSMRADGTMTSGGVAGRGAQAEENFRRFIGRHGLPFAAAVRCRQAHGKIVAAVAAKDRGTRVREVDGLVTATPQTYLTVTVGDCLPLYFFDPRRQAVGLAHGGWRSLEQGIAAETVRQLADRFGCEPSNVLAGIGPGIGPCHFVVGPEVAERFAVYPSALAKNSSGELTLDLPAVAASQLQGVGVRREHIELHPACPACWIFSPTTCLKRSFS